MKNNNPLTRIGVSCVLFLAMLLLFTGCNSFGDDELTDKKEIVTLYVSAKTGSMIGLTGVAHECMLCQRKRSDFMESMGI